MKKCYSVVDSVFIDMCSGRKRNEIRPYYEKDNKTPSRYVKMTKGLKSVEFYNTAMRDRLQANVTRVSVREVNGSDLEIYKKLYPGRSTKAVYVYFDQPIYFTKGSTKLPVKYRNLI